MTIRNVFMSVLSIYILMLESPAQYKNIQNVDRQTIPLSGNLICDIILQEQNSLTGSMPGDESSQLEGKKYSALKSGLFSAMLPGAGQFYTKSYWQSAAFLGAEVLLWIAYATYENQGDQRTKTFQNYANEHWSVVRYAYWIKNSSEYNGFFQDIIFNGSPPSIDVSQPYQYINWSELNVCEEEIGQQPHTGFSHKLENYGEQQYYEMIGKYPQFGGGWDDAGSFTANDIRTGNVSPNFLTYSQMRGDANSAYNIATTVTYVIVANHLFSALEAAWNASRINHRVSLHGHIQSRRIRDSFVEFVPTLDLRYEF